MSAKIDRVRDIVGGCMNEIALLFKPGVKITVAVRTTNYPDGSRDFVQTNDDLTALIVALGIRRDEEARALAAQQQDRQTEGE